MKKWLKEMYELFAPIIDFAVLAGVLSLLYALTSCKTAKMVEYVEVEKPVYVRDTLKEYLTQYDSVYVHDSIWYVQWLKGDTIYVEKSKTQTQYRDRIKHDTVKVVNEVPVETIKTVTQTVTQEVEKKLTWLQKTRMLMGDALGLCLLGGLIGLIVWLIKKRR